MPLLPGMTGRAAGAAAWHGFCWAGPMMRISKRPLLGLLYVTAATPLAAVGLYPLSTLQAQVERFAGRPALIDSRLLLPDCAAPDLVWAVPGRSVRVHCTAPEWQVFVSVGNAAAPAPELVNAAVPATEAPVPARPQIRRGDRVMVEADGERLVLGLAPLYTSLVEVREAVLRWRAVVRDRR